MSNEVEYKELTNFRNMLNEVMDNVQLPLRLSSEFEDILGHVAKEIGVQPNDLSIYIAKDKKTGEIKDTFIGCEDPQPDKHGIIPAKDAVQRSWENSGFSSGPGSDFAHSEQADEKARRLNKGEVIQD